MNNTLKVGVTGGIGSGKSTVCRIFSLLGIPVYDADSRAKWLMVHQPDLVREIKSLFGDESYENGRLNRSYIASLTFNDSSRLKKLNSLVHPAVGRDFEQWYHSSQGPYVIKEAALLIESGSYKTLDYLINVQAPESLRMKRVLSRDRHRDEQQVRDIMDKQLTDRERAEYADLTIDNGGEQMLIPQVMEADRMIREMQATS